MYYNIIYGKNENKYKLSITQPWPVQLVFIKTFPTSHLELEILVADLTINESEFHFSITRLKN